MHTGYDASNDLGHPWGQPRGCHHWHKGDHRTQTFEYIYNRDKDNRSHKLHVNDRDGIVVELTYAAEHTQRPRNYYLRIDMTGYKLHWSGFDRNSTTVRCYLPSKTDICSFDVW